MEKTSKVKEVVKTNRTWTNPEGKDLQICGQMGSVAAAYTVEKYGTQTHQFTLKEFEMRYKDEF